MEEQQRGDIRATLAISYTEALNGTTRTLVLPGGRQVTVSLPAGTYDSQQIRLANQGETPPRGGSPGALILTIAVTSPGYPDTPMYAQPGSNSPTEFIPPPPPPPASSSPGYPSIASGRPFTNYPPQGTGSGYSYPLQPAFTQPSQQAPSQQRRRLSPVLIVLLFILALLLIGGGGFTYYITIFQPAQIHAQATATAQAKIQGTVQAHATSTAQAVATAQAAAQATATAIAQINTQATATVTALQGIYTQATSGTPALSDPLSAQDSNNWDVASNCAFIGGVYHISESKQGFFHTCNANSTNFGNLAVQVQMVITRGDYGGILFRSDSSASNFYAFSVYQDGSYDLDVFKNNNQLKTLSSGSSSALKTGLNQSNSIAVVARGSSIYLYINGQFVSNVNDKNFVAGQIGLFAGDDTHAADVAFSNLSVWRA